MGIPPLEHPIVAAPMAGGPTTPALAAAVSEAGGLGFLAGGYASAERLAADIDELRRRTTAPFGVNLFVPSASTADPSALAAYRARLEPVAARLGVALGEPRWSDDGWDAKLALVLEVRPPVASFTFGLPPASAVEQLHARGMLVWCTVTSPSEAAQAAAVGADALVVQGAEAGAHRGSFVDGGDEGIGLLALLGLVRSAVGLPLVGAGGIADGAGVAAVLAAGARAAQIGTGFLLCPEAGTSEVHRRALAGDDPTAVTRAFTGRSARGIVNAFVRDHSAQAPKAYPEVHYLTAPLRAQARATADAENVNLWAGQAYRLAEAAPAAELVRRWSADARAALEALR
ncbi:MAG TPA: nitronate monooxygenase [Gaiellaceae bacterium]|nr:nitronate monooxygenase [Gaiellaceae bacterium]